MPSEDPNALQIGYMEKPEAAGKFVVVVANHGQIVCTSEQLNGAVFVEPQGAQAFIEIVRPWFIVGLEQGAEVVREERAPGLITPSLLEA